MLCIINLLFCFENHLVAISLLSRISFLKITHPFPLFGRVCLLIQCRFHWSFTHTERRNPPHWERGISFFILESVQSAVDTACRWGADAALVGARPNYYPHRACLPCQYTHKEPTALRQILFMGSRLQFLRDQRQTESVKGVSSTLSMRSERFSPCSEAKRTSVRAPFSCGRNKGHTFHQSGCCKGQYPRLLAGRCNSPVARAPDR